MVKRTFASNALNWKVSGNVRSATKCLKTERGFCVINAINLQRTSVVKDAKKLSIEKTTSKGNDIKIKKSTIIN